MALRCPKHRAVAISGLIIVAFLRASLASAQEPGGTQMMAEAEWDWHPGDLLFRNDLNELDELIRQAEGGKWASIGILRASSGGPRVVHADQEQGVTEVMLYEFVDGLTGSDYAAYRLASLDPNAPGLQMEMGPLASFSLLVAYDAPHDDRIMFGNDGYYNAEPPFVAALNGGVVPGKPIRLADLGRNSLPLQNAQSPDECWTEISKWNGLAVVTPGVLLGSDLLTQVYP
ncbi:peptidoglycan peptidase [Paracoccus sp. M683]|uniref:peptidoglycan peptidase n=1 Tax=Paracoccus sp. M683 TaxID=2594268 RepID=UPI00117D85F3|nr:peptidoglycan peptidase [Paracoccus sp. M683]TRW96031.1 peptidoglycan peptidase [Paracoccus sp. M683]